MQGKAIQSRGRPGVKPKKGKSNHSTARQRYIRPYGSTNDSNSTGTSALPQIGSAKCWFCVYLYPITHFSSPELIGRNRFNNSADLTTDIPINVCICTAMEAYHKCLLRFLMWVISNQMIHILQLVIVRGMCVYVWNNCAVEILWLMVNDLCAE